MKTSFPIASSLALLAALAGCNEQSEVATPSQSSSVAAGNMSDMAMPAEIKHGRGAGTVTAIDSAKGTVTLDHGDIIELKWPAMEMAFSAQPEALAGIKIGDKVDFEIDWDGKAGTVTRLKKAEISAAGSASH